MIRYETERRNGYAAVDMYDGQVCIRNVYVGTQKEAALVASVANEAVHRAFPLDERQKHGVLRGIQLVLDTLGDDEGPKTDQEVALAHTMVDGLTALREVIEGRR
jgi:hypothetical protein